RHRGRARLAPLEAVLQQQRVTDLRRLLPGEEAVLPVLRAALDAVDEEAAGMSVGEEQTDRPIARLRLDLRRAIVAASVEPQRAPDRQSDVAAAGQQHARTEAGAARQPEILRHCSGDVRP